VKTRICVVMLVLGCFVGMSVYAARKSPKEKTAVPAGKTDTATQAKKQKAVLLKTEVDKVSYSIGVQLGQNFKQQEIEISVESMMRGLRDAMAGKTLALSEDEMQKVMMDFQQRMMAKQKERQQAEAAKNLAKGMAFLEANGSKEGVTVLPSGLQYKIIQKGTGRTPTINDRVKTNYRGTFIDGTEFDSSYKRNKPVEFPVKGVIKGWTEALQLMKEGGKWELYVPANLAYGEQDIRGIPGNSTLIFEIELLEVLEAPKVVPKK